MLQTNAVAATTLELLKQLCSFKELDEFALVGGTNLALRYGHRMSVDLDFFTSVPYDATGLTSFITKKFRRYELLFQRNQTLIFDIDGIRVDFVLYPFPWLQRFDDVNQIRLASVEDIIPMKLQGIENRKSKKDLWDIAELFGHYRLYDMLQIMKNKFPFVDTAHIVHSLTFFEEADLEPDPIALNSWTWEFVKERVKEEVLSYTRLFLT